jgi:ubiquinone/menaquinone biosynthesis C-methylase UbiE
MTAGIPFYVELAREADGPLVELAVGNGRVAIPVARATGRRVIGIDSSLAMFDQARARAPRRAWTSTYTLATCETSLSPSQRH